VGGALSPKSPATVATGDFPRGLAVSPDGDSVYVTSLNTDNVFQYDAGSNGTLTPKSPATVAAGNVPWQVTVSPDGDSVYVTNELDDTVSQYDVGAGGALAAKTPATVAAGDFPEALVVSADADSVYVANSGSSSVSQYNVGGGGLLSPKFPATVPAGDLPIAVAVGPPECQDTRDNDGDGSSDFPDDPSCTSATDPGEASFMFGKAAVGSAFSPMSSNVKRASPSLLWFGPVTVTGFRAYLDGGGALSGSQVVRAVLYRHQGGPSQLVAQSLAKTVVAGRIDGFVDFELPTPVSLDPGYYWLGLHSGATHGVARFGWNFGTQIRVYNIDWFADGASNPFGGNTFQDDQVITMYAVGHREAGGTQ
jgi:hypothetical protein